LLVAAAAQSGGKYGVVVSGKLTPGKLTPEAVKYGALEIGRFEVTRAQYFAWDNGYPVEKGTENFPANGITPAQARAYTEWLSNLTGQSWRLPDEEEVAALYGAATEAQENTLKKGATAALKEAGSFPPSVGANESAIYDLGGNVAEWVNTKEGKSKLLGGSAERPAGSKQTPDYMYAGFRVIRVLR